jgi:hypothetical protein
MLTTQPEFISGARGQPPSDKSSIEPDLSSSTPREAVRHRGQQALHGKFPDVADEIARPASACQ